MSGAAHPTDITASNGVIHTIDAVIHTIDAVILPN
mgnify:CR=1 FL=1